MSSGIGSAEYVDLVIGQALPPAPRGWFWSASFRVSEARPPIWQSGCEERGGCVMASLIGQSSVGSDALHCGHRLCHQDRLLKLEVVSSGLFGSNSGKSFGGLFGTVLAICGRSVRGSAPLVGCATLVLQHMV